VERGQENLRSLDTGLVCAVSSVCVVHVRQYGRIRSLITVVLLPNGGISWTTRKTHTYRELSVDDDHLSFASAEQVR